MSSALMRFAAPPIMRVPRMNRARTNLLLLPRHPLSPLTLLLCSLCSRRYVGGIAELFKSSRKEERLYLSARKGFIKMALRNGVDVIPLYLMGNTSVLTVLKWGPLASLSRKLQASIT
jgi:hypothetical protein